MSSALMIFTFIIAIIGMGMVIATNSERIWCMFIGIFLLIIGISLAPISGNYRYIENKLSEYKKIMVENNIAEYNSEGKFVVKEKKDEM